MRKYKKLSEEKISGSFFGKLYPAMKSEKFVKKVQMWMGQLI